MFGDAMTADVMHAGDLAGSAPGRGPSRHAVLVGPTASGKSAIAHEIARSSAGEFEVVSVDSMQVYRGMDIGTAKPTRAERDEVSYHLLDLADPSEEFSVAAFQRAARDALADIESRGRRALLVGGTGLYVQAVVDNFEVPGRYPEVRARLDAQPDTWGLHADLMALDPLAASRMERGNRRRILRALEVTIGSGRPFSSYGPGVDAYPDSAPIMLGLRPSVEDLDRRIEARVAAMIEAGFVDEVARLAGSPGGMGSTAHQALGYRELLRYLSADIDLEEAAEQTRLRTRQFARRQVRWFRRDPRITWLDVDETNRGRLAARVAELLADPQP